jgi:hypothetical protein
MMHCYFFCNVCNERNYTKLKIFEQNRNLLPFFIGCFNRFIAVKVAFTVFLIFICTIKLKLSYFFFLSISFVNQDLRIFSGPTVLPSTGTGTS